MKPNFDVYLAEMDDNGMKYLVVVRYIGLARSSWDLACCWLVSSACGKKKGRKETGYTCFSVWLSTRKNSEVQGFLGCG